MNNQMITATIIKLERKPSRYGGFFYYCFMKGEDGRSYYTCLFPKMRNYKRWKKVMQEGIVLSNLKLVSGKDKLVNADSRFKIVEE